ncbi:MAG TPA: hypothetical protein VI542_12505 [Candidatus Tectomicrobia bacterium]
MKNDDIGEARGEQKAIVKSLIRLGLTSQTAARRGRISSMAR